MIETAYTPGPWFVEPVCGEDDQQFFDDDFNGKVWAVCHPRTVCDATTVVPWINEADARLIAAAPELLEVAKTLLAFTKGTIERAGLTDTNGIVAAAEAVIAKVIP